MKKYSKVQWKRFIKQYIKEKTRNDLLSRIKNYKKLNYQQLSQEEFKCQPYLHQLKLADSRMKFKINSMMVPSIAMNFPSDPQYTRDRWTCTDCCDPSDPEGGAGMINSQSHVLACQAHADLRLGVDLQDDRQLVSYFREVIQRRQDRASGVAAGR